MDKKMLMKVGGVVAIVGGSVSLYLAGIGESEVIGIIAGVFVLAGVISALFG